MVKVKSEDGDSGGKYRPDFNELMEESANDLQMDISNDASADRDGGHLNLQVLKSREENNNKIDEADIKDHVLFSSPKQNLLSSISKTSAASAFRPVTSDTKDISLSSSNNSKCNMETSTHMSNAVAMSPLGLGPYPPMGATFVGYPDNPGVTSPEKEPPPSLASEKPTTNICVLQSAKTKTKMSDRAEELTNCISMNERRTTDSPDSMQKEYIILQPANSTSKVSVSPLRGVPIDENVEPTPATAASMSNSFVDSSSTHSPHNEHSSKHLPETARFTENSSNAAAAALSKGKWISDCTSSSWG